MKQIHPKAILLSLLLLPSIVKAHKEDWVKFSAKYDNNTVCITEVDLNLIEQQKLMQKRPFLVKTGIRFNNPTDQGLMSDEEKPTIELFVNSVKFLLDKEVKFSHAGNFTNRDVQIQYFYASDTTNLRQLFVKMYAQNYPKYNLALTLKYEPDWDSYFNFLYPNKNHLTTVKTGKGPTVVPPRIPKLSGK